MARGFRILAVCFLLAVALVACKHQPIRDSNNSGYLTPSDIGRTSRPVTDTTHITGGRRCEKYGEGKRGTDDKGRHYICRKAIGGLRWRIEH